MGCICKSGFKDFWVCKVHEVEPLRQAMSENEKNLQQEISRLREALKGLMPFNGYGNCFLCDLKIPIDDEKIHLNSQGEEIRCLMHPDYNEARQALEGGNDTRIL